MENTPAYDIREIRPVEIAAALALLDDAPGANMIQRRLSVGLHCDDPDLGRLLLDRSLRKSAAEGHHATRVTLHPQSEASDLWIRSAWPPRVTGAEDGTDSANRIRYHASTRARNQRCSRAGRKPGRRRRCRHRRLIAPPPEPPRDRVAPHPDRRRRRAVRPEPPRAGRGLGLSRRHRAPPGAITPTPRPTSTPRCSGWPTRATGPRCSSPTRTCPPPEAPRASGGATHCCGAYPQWPPTSCRWCSPATAPSSTPWPP